MADLGGTLRVFAGWRVAAVTAIAVADKVQPLPDIDSHLIMRPM
jgi:hypothetical protein